MYYSHLVRGDAVGGRRSTLVGGGSWRLFVGMVWRGPGPCYGATVSYAAAVGNSRGARRLCRRPHQRSRAWQVWLNSRGGSSDRIASYYRQADRPTDRPPEPPDAFRRAGSQNCDMRARCPLLNGTRVTLGLPDTRAGCRVLDVPEPIPDKWFHHITLDFFSGLTWRLQNVIRINNYMSDYLQLFKSSFALV